ncbi:hypothetical protein [Pseudomonas sp. SWI44]|uniref:hypothetical protein n=1 Tax=Pseudomonas sp. SWI44 TaxID=2083053 RepID=UPI000CE5F5E3|nr:hypothetical protein [Pseudomonas sp. SWI44]AVD86003.1 hypothetical protein C4Q26_02045 [Pseudomonas sp. SWI44]
MPTENRSSNTEMVSAKVCGYTPGQSQVELRLAEIRTLPSWLEIGETVTVHRPQPAPQLHPDPIAWMVGTAFWWTKEEAERDAAETGKTITPIGPMFDTGEIDQLSQIIRNLNDERDEIGAEVGRLRAQLAERDALLRDLEGKTILSWPDKRRISAALSASAEPSAPIAWHVGGNGYDRISFEKPANLPGHPCIQAIHDQRQLIDLLKRYDLRDEDAPPDERGQGIPGTSFQRLNGLANQGE